MIDRDFGHAWRTMNVLHDERWARSASARVG